MKKVIHILGVRPHCIKFSPITDNDIIIWTGQHYSKEMSEYLIKEFNLPIIKYYLNKTDLIEMQQAIAKVLKKENPDLVVVYGDTKSTLSGTMAAYELGIKIAHIEAGVRSINYPDRIENKIRIIVDNHSDYLLCPTKQALLNIYEEKILEKDDDAKAIFVGDTHYDEHIKHRKHQGFVLATFHRAEHTDTKESLDKIFDMLRHYDYVIFPCHPRTWEAIERFDIDIPENVVIISPISYREMRRYYKNAQKVITDSGGVTKEAFFAGCPVEPYEIDEWQEIFSFGSGNAKELIKKELLKVL